MEDVPELFPDQIHLAECGTLDELLSHLLMGPQQAADSLPAANPAAAAGGAARSAPDPSSDFSETFWMTYRDFGSPDVVVERLRAELLCPPPEQAAEQAEEARAFVARKRWLLSLLQRWAWDYPTDLTPPLVAKLASMFEALPEPSWEQCLVSLPPLEGQEAADALNTMFSDAIVSVRSAANRRQGSLRGRSRLLRSVSSGDSLGSLATSASSASVSGSRQSLSGVFDPEPSVSAAAAAVSHLTLGQLLDGKVKPDTVADQLTLLQIRLLGLVSARDLTETHWFSANHTVESVWTRSPGAMACVEWHNQVFHWTLLQLQHDAPEADRVSTHRRTAMLRYLVELADLLHARKNYELVFAVTGALQADRKRRKHSASAWKALPEAARGAWDKLERLVSPLRNFYRYRIELAAAVGSGAPHLPFFGVLLADLVSAHPRLGRPDSEDDGDAAANPGGAAEGATRAPSAGAPATGGTEPLVALRTPRRDARAAVGGSRTPPAAMHRRALSLSSIALGGVGTRTPPLPKSPSAASSSSSETDDHEHRGARRPVAAGGAHGHAQSSSAPRSAGNTPRLQLRGAVPVSTSAEWTVRTAVRPVPAGRVVFMGPYHRVRAAVRDGLLRPRGLSRQVAARTKEVPELIGQIDASIRAVVVAPVPGSLYAGFRDSTLLAEHRVERGTVGQLLRFLSWGARLDSDFRDAFFLTYPAFCSAELVRNEILDQLSAAPPLEVPDDLVWSASPMDDDECASGGGASDELSGSSRAQPPPPETDEAAGSERAAAERSLTANTSSSAGGGSVSRSGSGHLLVGTPRSVDSADREPSRRSAIRGDPRDDFVDRKTHLAGLLQCWMFEFPCDFVDGVASDVHGQLAGFPAEAWADIVGESAIARLDELYGNLRESVAVCQERQQQEFARRASTQRRNSVPDQRFAAKFTAGPVPVSVRAPAAAMARQMTLLSADLQAAIPVRELTGTWWMKEQHKQARAPHVLACISHHNRSSWWVAAEVLEGGDVAGRARTLCYFLEVAEECVRLGNFDGAVAIIGGLVAAPVHRLSLTWAALPRSASSRWEKLRRLSSTDMSHSYYRSVLAATAAGGRPVVPFLGVLLGDLARADAAPSSAVGGTGGGVPAASERDKWCDFSRHLATHSLVREFCALRKQPFGFAADPAVQAIVLEGVIRAQLDDFATLLELSRSIEPADKTERGLVVAAETFRGMGW